MALDDLPRIAQHDAVGRDAPENISPSGDPAASANRHPAYHNGLRAYPDFILNDRVGGKPPAFAVNMVALSQRNAVKKRHIAADAGACVDHNSSPVRQCQTRGYFRPPGKLYAGPLACEAMP